MKDEVRMKDGTQESRAWQLEAPGTWTRRTRDRAECRVGRRSPLAMSWSLRRASSSEQLPTSVLQRRRNGWHRLEMPPKSLAFFVITFCFCTSLLVHAQNISTSIPVPPLQWINLSNLLQGSSGPPPLRDASVGYDDTRYISPSSRISALTSI